MHNKGPYKQIFCSFIIIIIIFTGNRKHNNWNLKDTDANNLEHEEGLEKHAYDGEGEGKYRVKEGLQALQD